MSFRPQARGRSASRQSSKSAREKKAKEKKRKANSVKSSSIQYADVQPEVSPKEFAQKTLAALNRMGNQIFALSPYSQYFDDWLVNLRQAISEFESSPVIRVDEQFVKERQQIFLDVEGVLAEKKLQESNVTGAAKELADNNHLIVETDKLYAEQTRDLSNRRNSEVQRLSNKIRDLEISVASQEELKFRVFQLRAKRRAAEQLAQARKDLVSAKNELELALQSFTAEQEKLHDSYQRKKQELSDRSDSLHEELEKLEVDTSVDIRKTACATLSDAINKLQSRIPSTK
jgi:hypothetical protein